MHVRVRQTVSLSIADRSPMPDAVADAQASCRLSSRVPFSKELLPLTNLVTLMEFSVHSVHTGAANSALRSVDGTTQIICVDLVQTMPPTYSDEGVYRVSVV